MKTVIFLGLALYSGIAGAAADAGSEIKAQFKRLHALASGLDPEFDVGGYLNGKTYGDHELLWHLAEEPGEAEVVKIFRDKGEGEQPFEITFHRNSAIVPGRTVIRRFIGPARTGWRNDTVDADTGEYLGSQGQENPALDARDREIMKRWLPLR